MRIVAAALVALALGLWLLPPPTGAGEGNPAELEVRIYPVRSLTMGRRDHARTRGSVLDLRWIHEDQRPLFGAEGGDPASPVGSAWELVDRITTLVEPHYWQDAPGAWAMALGEHRVLVRASPVLHRQVRSFLDDLQAGIGRTVSIELELLRFDSGAPLPRGAALSEEAAASLFDRATARTGASIRCFSGQRAALFAGRQVSWLYDVETEIAKDGGDTNDPIVEVSNFGLVADVCPVLRERSALVHVDVILTSGGWMRTVSTQKNGRLEAPPHDSITLRPTLEVPLDRWVVVAARGGDEPWLCLLRATAHAYESAEGRDPVVGLGRPLLHQDGAMTTARFDVRDLARPVPEIAGRDTAIWPSDSLPPEPDILEDPAATLRGDALAELLRVVAEEEVWEDPASLEVRGGVLIVRNRGEVVERIRKHLATLRAKLLWTLVVEAEIVEVPDALATARSAGIAQRLETLRLTSSQGRRNVLRAGREIRYLADYEVEVAQASKIGDPVMRTVLDGLQLDVRAGLSPDGGSVQLDVELQRNEVDLPIRSMPTEHGPIELPALTRVAIRTAAQVPLGRTALVASWTRDGRRRLLLLTPRLR